MNKTVFDFEFDLPKIESWSVLAGSWHSWSNVITQTVYIFYVYSITISR